MKIAVAIETKDRRLTGHQENYLGRTLANLRRTGFFESPTLHSLHIVSGGEQPDFIEREVLPAIPDLFSSRKVFYHDAPKDCTRHQNAARAIRAASRTNADWVMKLEDDLDFISDFLDSTARWLADYGDAPVPMFALAATFDFVSKSRFVLGEKTIFDGNSDTFPRVRAYVKDGHRFAYHPVNGWWGAQAVVWRQPLAAELAKWLGTDPFLDDGKQEHRHRGHDLLLQHWGNSLRAKSFGVAVPAFVQHIGRQSNLDQPEIGHMQPFFEFPWAGPHWVYEGGRHV